MNKYLVSAVSLGALVYGASRVRTKRKHNGVLATSPLVGTWKLLTGSFTATNSNAMDDHWDSGTITQFKIVTPDRFMFYSMRNNSQSIQWAAMGKVIIEDDQYTEIVENSNAMGLPGKELTFNFRIINDRWHHSINTGEGILEEVWVRVS